MVMFGGNGNSIGQMLAKLEKFQRNCRLTEMVTSLRERGGLTSEFKLGESNLKRVPSNIYSPAMDLLHTTRKVQLRQLSCLVMTLSGQIVSLSSTVLR